jgi:hypothetical protein
VEGDLSESLTSGTKVGKGTAVMGHRALDRKEFGAWLDLTPAILDTKLGFTSFENCSTQFSRTSVHSNHRLAIICCFYNSNRSIMQSSYLLWIRIFLKSQIERNCG